ncbi:MAG TPA: LytTR family DNA-binding domain-containing protein [Acidobacteriota bacterium]|nr:LytTR family DNA-binding domain-containing protein [Acidobacteriota bacterium]
MKALIVDDEAPARERMRQLLAAFGDVEVAGEAADGQGALDKIRDLNPDVVFLDIQMPGINGLEVAASLPSPRPLIVFCTAYDQYAVDAFEMFALDYLLKPVTRARLKKSVERARLRVQREASATAKGTEADSPPSGQPSGGQPDGDTPQKRQSAPGRAATDDSHGNQEGAEISGDDFEARLDEAVRKARRPIRFLARHKSGFQVVPEADVLYFGSEDGYTKLCTSDREYWIDPTLTDLEKRLDEALFFRVSRSALVRLDAVSQVDPMPGGHGQLTLRNGTGLDISRRRMKPLLDRLQTG